MGKVLNGIKGTDYIHVYVFLCLEKVLDSMFLWLRFFFAVELQKNVRRSACTSYPNSTGEGAEDRSRMSKHQQLYLRGHQYDLQVSRTAWLLAVKKDVLRTHSNGTATCVCRSDMRWNALALECQLFIDVDCSDLTYRWPGLHESLQPCSRAARK